MHANISPSKYSVLKYFKGCNQFTYICSEGIGMLICHFLIKTETHIEVNICGGVYVIHKVFLFTGVFPFIQMRNLF